MMKLSHIAGVALFASAGIVMAGPEMGGDKSTVTTAPSSATHDSQAFDKLDRNGDGYLTKVEAQERISDYDQADSDSDGRLDRGEFSAFEVDASTSTHDSMKKDTDRAGDVDLDATP